MLKKLFFFSRTSLCDPAMEGFLLQVLYKTRHCVEAAFRQQAWAVETWVGSKGSQRPPGWMHTAPVRDPPQNIHRPPLTNGLLNTGHRYQKKEKFIRSHTASLPHLTIAPHHCLLQMVSPLLSCWADPLQRIQQTSIPGPLGSAQWGPPKQFWFSLHFPEQNVGCGVRQSK